MSAGILQLGEAILKVGVDDAGLKAGIATAKSQADSFREALAVKSGTGAFASYIGEVKALGEAFKTGKLESDQYAQGLERAFQRMRSTSGASREAAAELARAVAPATPLDPSAVMAMRTRENRRLLAMGLRGEEGGINQDEYRARRSMIASQYEAELALTPQVLQQRQQLNAAMSISNALDQRGAALKEQFATAQERHNARMAEYRQLLDSNRISQELFAKAAAESQRTMLAETSRTQMALPGMKPQGMFSGAMAPQLIGAGSYAIQDFATVMSMKGMGLGDAMRAASNNVGMMAMMVGGASGSLVAALVTLAAVAPGLWQKFSGGSKAAADEVAGAAEKMKAAFDEMRAAHEANLSAKAGIRSDREIKTAEAAESRLSDLSDRFHDAAKERDRSEKEFAKLDEQMKRHRMEQKVAESGTFVPDRDLKAEYADLVAKRKRGEIVPDEQFIRTERRFKGLPTLTDSEAAEIEQQRNAARERFLRNKFEATSTGTQIDALSARLPALRKKEVEDYAKQQGIEALTGQKKELAEIAAKFNRERDDLMQRIGLPQRDKDRRLQQINEAQEDAEFRVRDRFNKEASEKRQKREADLEDQMQKARRAVNPRGAAADEVLGEKAKRDTAIRREHGDSDQARSLLKESAGAARAQLLDLRQQGQQRGSLGFSDQVSMFKNIQTQVLGADQTLKAQKDTTAEIKATNQKLDSLISKLNDVNLGLQ